MIGNCNPVRFVKGTLDTIVTRQDTMEFMESLAVVVDMAIRSFLCRIIVENEVLYDMRDAKANHHIQPTTVVRSDRFDRHAPTSSEVGLTRLWLLRVWGSRLVTLPTTFLPRSCPCHVRLKIGSSVCPSVSLSRLRVTELMDSWIRGFVEGGTGTISPTMIVDTINSIVGLKSSDSTVEDMVKVIIIVVRQDVETLAIKPRSSLENKYC